MPDTLATLPASTRISRYAAIFGPGLVVMLADTDVGSIITAAQSGAQWGYRLLLLQAERHEDAGAGPALECRCGGDAPNLGDLPLEGGQKRHADCEQTHHCGERIARQPEKQPAVGQPGEHGRSAGTHRDPGDQKFGAKSVQRRPQVVYR